ncbi:hypothetical protein [Saccharothrix australiensis]|uniref:Uncharacterized protein n=1 Tax=Saccharothrix australiensis TaxID=2072 RepID=A0A495W396_9PSEU|nr:hypothetical protein [Saccharothrix australiensis]RKT56146.1 hypothetical protein C8E97_4835 [Saccharothrix australiensis]
MTSPNPNVVPLSGRGATATPATPTCTIAHVLATAVVIGFAMWLMTAHGYALLPALGASLSVLAATLTIVHIGRLPALVKRLVLRMVADHGPSPDHAQR